MNTIRTVTLVAALLAAPAASWGADQKAITLPADNAMATLAPGPGMEIARASCGLCHSTDYIVRQPRSTAQQWQAEVAKMVKVFGAPITPDNEKSIAEYLASAYGSGT